MTIQEKVKELYDALEQKERVNGGKYYCLKDGSPEWMRNAIYKAHGDRLPDDSIYEVVNEVAGVLAYADTNANIDDLRELITQIEPDIITNELTNWLAENVNNVYYLTQALENNPDLTDGFLALATAQHIFKEEIGNIVLEELNKQEGTK